MIHHTPIDISKKYSLKIKGEVRNYRFGSGDNRTIPSQLPYNTDHDVTFQGDKK